MTVEQTSQPVSPLAPSPALGPVARRAPINRTPYLYAAVGGAGALILIGMVGILFSALSDWGGGDDPGARLAGGPPRSAWWALPENTEGLLYVDFDKVRQSQLGPLLEKAAVAQPGRPPELSSMAEFGYKHVTDMMVVFQPDGKSVFVFGTDEDFSLQGLVDRIAELLAKHREVAASEFDRVTRATYEGVPFITDGRGVFVKVDSCTYYLAIGSGEYKHAINRLLGKEPITANPKLRQGLERAPGDHFVVIPGFDKGPGSSASLPRPLADMPPPDWIAMGVTLDGSLTLDGVIRLPGLESAQQFRQLLDERVAKLGTEWDKLRKLPAPVRRAALSVVDLVQEIQFSQTGTEVTFHASWSIERLKAIFEQLPQIPPGSVFPGGSSFPWR